MKLNLKKLNEGFTIIEVLIVLAIAGLILLIVFLAVPALQRSNRNTGRRSEAARLASASANFTTNNNGATPSVAADITAVITDAGTLQQFSGLAVASPLGTAAAGKMSLIAAGFTSPQAAITVNGTQLVVGGKCGTAGAVVTGTTRQMALQYTLEDAGGNYTTSTCIDV